MKTLSIQTTVLPKGERITWVNGMPAHSERELHTNQFNAWSQYIHNELIKSRMWNKIIDRIKVANTVKPGGVCHQEGQESFLKQVKEMLR